MSKPQEANAGPKSRLSSTILNLKFMQRAQEKKAKVEEVQAREERDDEVRGQALCTCFFIQAPGGAHSLSLSPHEEAAPASGC